MKWEQRLGDWNGEMFRVYYIFLVFGNSKLFVFKSLSSLEVPSISTRCFPSLPFCKMEIYSWSDTYSYQHSTYLGCKPSSLDWAWCFCCVRMLNWVLWTSRVSGVGIRVKPSKSGFDLSTCTSFNQRSSTLILYIEFRVEIHLKWWSNC